MTRYDADMTRGPRFLLRDRDSIYGGEFRRRAKSIGIAEALTTPRSPWQNPFAERVIGTIRRELLDHVIVLNEGHLRGRLRSYSVRRNATMSFFSASVSFVPSTMLKNSTVSSSVSRRPSCR